MFVNAPSFSYGSFCGRVIGSRAGAGLAAFVTSPHSVGEGCITFVTIGFPGAAAAGVVEVLSNAMSPAIRDGFTIGICSLCFGFAGVTVVGGTAVLFSDHGLEKVFDFI